jgi:ATP-dependent protease ClpP protease subunit
MTSKACGVPAIPQMIVSRSNNQYIETMEKTYYHHNIFLDCPIQEPDQYREMIALLFSSSENDTIDIFFNSDGGHLDTALAVVEALKLTPAHVRGILIGACHSACSIISMYCDEIVVLDNAYSMIHTATFGSQGNTGNVRSHTEFTVKMVENLLNETYEGFLTKDELIKVKQGVEIWFDAEAIRKRMASRNKFLKSKHKKDPKSTE